MIQLILQILLVVFNLGEPVVDNEDLVKENIECNKVFTKKCEASIYEC